MADFGRLMRITNKKGDFKIGEPIKVSVTGNSSYLIAIGSRDDERFIIINATDGLITLNEELCAEKRYVVHGMESKATATILNLF